MKAQVCDECVGLGCLGDEVCPICGGSREILVPETKEEIELLDENSEDKFIEFNEELHTPDNDEE